MTSDATEDRYFDGLRRAHARAFLLYMLPVIVAIGVTLDVASIVFQPGDDDVRMIVVTGLIVPIAVFGALSTRWFDPLAMALPVIGASSAWVVVAAVAAPDHVGASIMIVCPLIAMAYFRTPANTVALTIASAVILTIAFVLTPDWTEPGIVPIASFFALVAGGLLTFLSRQQRRSERDLDLLLSQKQSVIDAMEDVSRMRERLVASVSHELRTPLTSIIGFVETLRREDVALSESDRAALLSHAAEGGDRLMALVEELLTLSTVSTSTLHMASEPVSARGVIVSSVAGIDVPPDRSVRVTDDDVVSMRMDERRIAQVITNLVVNARNHGAGDIVIVCGESGDQGLIDVLDDGDGIPSALLGELFLPFARFSDRSDSTGLGLAISRVIAEAHGGSLSYDRVDGRTRFRLALPLDGPS